jgi:hypothetical protein
VFAVRSDRPQMLPTTASALINIPHDLFFFPEVRDNATGSRASTRGLVIGVRHLLSRLLWGTEGVSFLHPFPFRGWGEGVCCFWFCPNAVKVLSVSEPWSVLPRPLEVAAPEFFPCCGAALRRQRTGTYALMRDRLPAGSPAKTRVALPPSQNPRFQHSCHSYRPRPHRAYSPLVRPTFGPGNSLGEV